MTTDQIVVYAIAGLFALLFLRQRWRARGVKNYSGAEAKERLRAGSILLDVRTAAERSRLSIPSSLHIPMHELPARMNELERHRAKEIICYCASGNRSVRTAIRLKEAGFTAANLQGGIASWNF